MLGPEGADMSEIVVGTDGTTAAREALLWSLEHAVRHDSVVTAVYVWRIPLELEIPFDLETIRSLQEDLSRRDISGFPRITAASMHGHPGPVLVERAQDADLLVVGARQHTDLRGSVSSYCLHHSRTPIAVIPGDASSQSSQQRHRIAVGVDLTPESAAALQWASREARSRGSDLVVAYAWQVAAGSLSDFTHHADTHRSQQAHADRALQNWVTTVLGPAPPIPVHLNADHGGPLDTLLSHTTRADLLVLGSRGHHHIARFLGGSLSGQIALHGNSPIVVVPMGR
jgi:nucleotide-binding universal stress UspA family protein